MNHTIEEHILSELAEIKSGFAFSRAIQNSPEGEVRVVQIKDLQLGHSIPWHDLASVECLPLMPDKMLKKDMILFSAKGAKNYAWHVDIEPQNSVCSALFHIIIPDTTKIDPAFLTWQINQARAQSFLSDASAGVTVKNIRIGALKDLPIVVPPREIQEKTAAYAQKASAEKQILTKLIENRETEMRALAAQLLTG